MWSIAKWLWTRGLLVQREAAPRKFAKLAWCRAMTILGLDVGVVGIEAAARVLVELGCFWFRLLRGRWRWRWRAGPWRQLVDHGLHDGALGGFFLAGWVLFHGSSFRESEYADGLGEGGLGGAIRLKRNGIEARIMGERRRSIAAEREAQGGADLVCARSSTGQPAGPSGHRCDCYRRQIVDGALTGQHNHRYLLVGRSEMVEAESPLAILAAIPPQLLVQDDFDRLHCGLEKGLRRDSQKLVDFLEQGLGQERFLEKGGALFDDAAMEQRMIGVTGHIEDREARTRDS